MASMYIKWCSLRPFSPFVLHIITVFSTAFDAVLALEEQNGRIALFILSYLDAVRLTHQSTLAPAGWDVSSVTSMASCRVRSEFRDFKLVFDSIIRLFGTSSENHKADIDLSRHSCQLSHSTLRSLQYSRVEYYVLFNRVRDDSHHNLFYGVDLRLHSGYDQ